MKKLFPKSFIALALATLMTAAFANQEVPNRAEDVVPLAVGERAPDFTASTPDGSDYEFTGQNLESPTLLIFYRGGWCPYCNTHLQELKNIVPALNNAGHDVLFLSADGPQNLVGSLKDPVPDYRLLSDAAMEAARAFGIAFHVDDETYARYKKYGIDLEEASGEDHHQLPVPSVFLIGLDGRIKFVHSNPDYKKRLSSDKLLTVAGL